MNFLQIFETSPASGGPPTRPAITLNPQKIFLYSPLLHSNYSIVVSIQPSRENFSENPYLAGKGDLEIKNSLENFSSDQNLAMIQISLSDHKSNISKTEKIQRNNVILESKKCPREIQLAHS